MNQHKIKSRFQRWVVTASIALMVGKFVAYWITNSVGILTDAAESIVNVVAGFMSLMALRWSAKPRDRKHPFGRGKIELISASIEGVMIAMAGGFIIWEGVLRLSDPAQIKSLDIGIVVVAVAGLANYILGAYSIKMGRRYDSVALVASGKHLQSDTYSSIGLVLGLILLYFTNLGWIDGTLAIIFGGVILFTGAGIIFQTVRSLLDAADMELISEVVQHIKQRREKDWITIHNAKMIKYGSLVYIDCDLTLPWYYNVIESHNACDKLEDLLGEKYGDRIAVSIHSDPCDRRFCRLCDLESCPHREERFEKTLEITSETIADNDEQLIVRLFKKTT